MFLHITITTIVSNNNYEQVFRECQILQSPGHYVYK